jgi:hypothetical protein
MDFDDEEMARICWRKRSKLLLLSPPPVSV